MAVGIGRTGRIRVEIIDQVCIRHLVEDSRRLHRRIEHVQRCRARLIITRRTIIMAPHLPPILPTEIIRIRIVQDSNMIRSQAQVASRKRLMLIKMYANFC